MAKEIFVIYNKNTGFIDGGSGKIKRKWDDLNKDGSTMSERIPEILAKDPDREVVYLQNQILPDPDKHKIVNVEIVELTESEITTVKNLKIDKIEGIDRVVG